MSARRLFVRLAAAVAWAMPVAAQAIACSVQTMPAAFGVYSPVSATAATATGAIDIGCTCQILVDCVAFTYRIDIAEGQSGSMVMRQMKAGSKILNYNLYHDAAYGTVWGVGGAGRSVLYLLALFGSYQRTTVYARMPSQQIVGPGNYIDMPAVTITY